MKVYVYRETNDSETFGGEIVKAFANKEDAMNHLRGRVENFFREPWERCVEIVEEAEGAIWPTYVEYPDSNGYNFFAIDTMEAK